MLVDTLGLVVALVVHEADIQDRDGAKILFEKGKNDSKTIKKVWCDGGYRGKLIEWVKKKYRIELEHIPKPEGQKGFAVLPRRWVVERTFAWLYRYRRLNKDYEFLIETSENMIYLCMINILLRRFGKTQKA